MQYILFLTLAVLFFFSYQLSGKDVLAPMTVQIITFLFVSLMCIYMLTYLNYKLRIDTIILIVSSLFLSAIVGIVVHGLFRRISIRQGAVSELKVSPITNIVHILVIAYIFAMLVWRMMVIHQLVSESNQSGQLMNIFYQLSNAGRESGELVLPFGLRQVDHVCIALFIVYGFNLIHFYKELSVGQRIINIFIIGLCMFTGFLEAQRMYAIQSIVACVMIYHLLRIKKTGKYRVYSIKALMRMIFICCIILFAFVLLSNVVGRGRSKANPMHRLGMYTGAEIINLDVFLKNFVRRTDVFGKYTFFGLIRNLRSMGLLDVPYYGGSYEYVFIDGKNLGNVYSFIRIYYADFGAAGVYILQFVFACITSISYEYTKKKLTNERILQFSYMYCGVVLSFFSEYFFSRVLSLGYIENVILILLFYRLFIRKKLFDISNKHASLKS